MSNIIQRNKSEKRFQFYGLLAVGLAIFLLLVLLFKIFSTGFSAFNQTYLGVKIQIEKGENLSELDARSTLRKNLRNMFPEAQSRSDKKNLYSLFSPGAYIEFKEMLEAYDGDVIDGYYYFLASDDLDMYFKGTVARQGNSAGRIKPSQMKFVDEFVKMNLIELQFNRYLLGSADSRNPEMAGILGAIYGSLSVSYTHLRAHET